jgi:dTDP-4-dehydrorhamnose 3,5-epimerase
MSRFQVTDTPLMGLKLVKRSAMGDARGFLSRLYCTQDLESAGWNQPIAQINHTLTQQRGAVRGLHYQLPPHAEKKLVSCIRGKVWDVAVDLRKGSPSFLQWCAQELSAENQIALLIPEGFAHGFQVLSDQGAELLYLHSNAYAPGYEGAVSAFDPRIGITWPLAVSDISLRDQSHSVIGENFLGVDCV